LIGFFAFYSFFPLPNPKNRDSDSAPTTYADSA